MQLFNVFTRRVWREEGEGVYTPDGSKPKTIRDTSKAFVVHYWARLNVGTTKKCEFRQVLARASALVEELNNTAGEQK